MRRPLVSSTYRTPQGGKPDPNQLGPLWGVVAFPMVFFFILPIAALIFRSNPFTFLVTLQNALVWKAILLTLTTSLVTTFISVLLGLPIAVLLTNSGFRIRRYLDSLIDLPTVLPPSVAGLGLLLAFGRRGLLGSWLDGFGVSVSFTMAAVVMAQTFVSAPYFIKSAGLGLAGIDSELRNAAALDGANGWQILRYVDLPMAWKAMASGAIMTWARAIGEFGATILFAGNFPGRTQTMPLAIYVGFESNMDVAITLSIILIGFAFGILWTARHYLNSQDHQSNEVFSK